MSNGSGASAVNRDLIELFFIEKYHWLPQDIMRIPYKWIQKYFIIEKYKDAGISDKRRTEEVKKELAPKNKKRR
jgi:transposase